MITAILEFLTLVTFFAACLAWYTIGSALL